MRLQALAALFIAQIGVASAATVVCPINGKPFNYDPAPSEPIRGRDLDMRPVAAYRTPWPLPKCPENGFVVYKNDGYSPDELAKLRTFVSSERYQSMLKVHTGYYLAAVLRREAGNPPYEVAWSLAQAAWEVAEDPVRYKSYAGEALAAFNALPEGNQLDRRQNVLREMMSGELERRLGLFEAAERRFRRVRDEAEFSTGQLQHVIDFQLRLIQRKDTRSRRMPP